MRKSLKRFVAVAAVALAGFFVVAPSGAIAEIIDLLTFQSAVDAAQTVDPTLAAPANDGNHDFAVGGFERSNVELSHTGFSAQSGPKGQAPKGHVSSTSSAGLKQRWDVVCLAVSGKNAAMGIVPTTNPDSSTADSTPGVLAVHDGGPGGTLDLYAFYFGADPTDCATYVEGAIFPPVTGNILVHDEP